MAVRASSSSRLIALVKSSDLALWRSGIFSVIGARSLGAYLWDTMMEAGQEWDGSDRPGRVTRTKRRLT